MTQLTGQCLCGAVSFTADVAHREVGACHCSKCRRWSAGPFLGIGCDGDKITLEGEQSLTAYQSSPWGERCFCSTCGSIMFWRTQDRRHWEISTGCLDSNEGLQFSRQIFVDGQPAFYAFANETEKLTGAEFVALVMGDADKSSE